MSLSRRQFVYVTSLAAVAASAGPSLLAQDDSLPVSEMFSEEGSAIVANLSIEKFQWLIGERFSISSPGQKLGKLTLVAAMPPDPVKPSHASATVPSVALTGFLLRFQGKGGTLPQDTYTMQQSGLGTFPLFIVPEGPGGSDRPTYIATFTRFANRSLNVRIAPSE